jgi:hypothetical protein
MKDERIEARAPKKLASRLSRTSKKTGFPQGFILRCALQSFLDTNNTTDKMFKACVAEKQKEVA